MFGELRKKNFLKHFDKIVDSIEKRVSLNPSIDFLNEIYNFYTQNKSGDRIIKFFFENKILQKNVTKEGKYFFKYLLIPSWNSERYDKVDETKRYFQKLKKLFDKIEKKDYDKYILNFSLKNLYLISIFSVLRDFPSYGYDLEYQYYMNITQFIIQALEVKPSLFRNVDIYNLLKIKYIFIANCLHNRSYPRNREIYNYLEEIGEEIKF